MRAFQLFPLFALTFVGCIAQPAEPQLEEGPTSNQEQAWDSQDGNPTHATHSYLTEFAIDSLKARYPELTTYRAQLIDGANRELHELPLDDAEQEALRVEVQGTNWGADRADLLWGRARDTYAAGNKGKAYWYLGIILHYVEDMGCPSHAFHVVHQGSWSQKDNFELLALQRWAPSYASINRVDPKYASPDAYIPFSGTWAARDFTTTFPYVTYRLDFFPSTWFFISSTKSSFVKNRQGRTATVTKWALESALTHW